MQESERNHGGQAFVDYAAVITGLASEHRRTINCFRHPVVDGSIPSVETMTSILDRIDEGISNRETVYIHCWGGRGRTGTAVCCWAIRRGLTTPDQAVDYLQTLIRHNVAAFNPTPENSMQRDFVGKWRLGR